MAGQRTCADQQTFTKKKISDIYMKATVYKENHYKEEKKEKRTRKRVST